MKPRSRSSSSSSTSDNDDVFHPEQETKPGFLSKVKEKMQTKERTTSSSSSDNEENKVAVEMPNVVVVRPKRRSRSSRSRSSRSRSSSSSKSSGPEEKAQDKKPGIFSKVKDRIQSKDRRSSTSDSDREHKISKAVEKPKLIKDREAMRSRSSSSSSSSSSRGAIQ